MDILIVMVKMATGAVLLSILIPLGVIIWIGITKDK